jgi:hypothetical protein
MNELKREFVRSTHHQDGINHDERGADLYYYRQRLEYDFVITSFGADEMIQKMIYINKTVAYQMQFTFLNDQLA